MHWPHDKVKLADGSYKAPLADSESIPPVATSISRRASSGIGFRRAVLVSVLPGLLYIRTLINQEKKIRNSLRKA